MAFWTSAEDPTNSRHSIEDNEPPSFEPSPMVAAGNHLDILLAGDGHSVCFRGSGSETQSAPLSGHVVLHLVEATSIREISLQLKGKVKLPLHADSYTLPSLGPNNSSGTTVFLHDFKPFLHGEHTLKAGRHTFPFQLLLDPSQIPMSLAAFGGNATISYRLRAVASRSALMSNFIAVKPVHLMRSFIPVAMEYQQSLEVENTWAGKIMYSILLPHKAWAAGDTLFAVVKFTPIEKGGRVTGITTTLNETVHMYGKPGITPSERKRAIVTVRHAIVDGHAVYMETIPSGYATPGSSAAAQLHPRNPSSIPSTAGPAAAPAVVDEYFSHSQPPSRTSSSNQLSSLVPRMGGLRIENPPVPSEGPPEDQETTNELSAVLELPIPRITTPSHSTEPVVANHRVRWSILIANPDGHTSELRCSLPIVVLHQALLSEVRNATRESRRLLLGLAEDEEGQSGDVDLPSYPAHVRDRVANMYMPDAAARRVPNPWVMRQTWPTSPDIPQRPSSEPMMHPSVFVSGASTHLDAGSLEWVNSELLLSLSNQPPTPPAILHTPPESAGNSRRDSRQSSRAPSLERTGHSPEETGSPSTSHPKPHHGMFHVSMKPFTNLASRSSRKGHHAQSSAPPTTGCLHPIPSSSPSGPGTSGVQLSTSNQADQETSRALLERAFREVPDYEIAARGWLGGGITPLDSLRGLPSYQASPEPTDTEGRH